MLTTTKCCLYYSKIYKDLTKRWSLAQNQNKQIAYYMQGGGRGEGGGG